MTQLGLWNSVTRLYQSSFTFIDLFAGIGGTRLGFESAGGSCVFSSEWDKYAKKTYLANFNNAIFEETVVYMLIIIRCIPFNFNFILADSAKFDKFINNIQKRRLCKADSIKIITASTLIDIDNYRERYGD